MNLLLNAAVPVMLMLAEPGRLNEAADPREALATNFAIFVGFPSPEQGGPGAAQLVPGTLIPLETGPGAGDSLRRQVVEKSLSFTQAADKLWGTFRLDPARRRQMGKYEVLATGGVAELPTIGEAGVRLSATLLRFNNETATYRVRFLQGEKSLVDSTVPVARGGRAVVGGMDGNAAPYIFLFVEPSLSAEKIADAAALKAAGITQPEPIEKVPPAYPVEAKNEKITGLVILKFTVQSDGKVVGIQAIQDPDSRLTASAIEALRQWRFQPARDKDGKAIDALISVTFNFQLR
jgi:TonB family protein